jgi:hypothetical protein
LGTAAVLKVLRKDGAGPRERFDRETRFLMESPGPSFPAFFGAGVEEGRPWVAMELLEEYPLPSSDGAVAAYLLDVAGGVAELHRRNWVHRDLKPRNILRRPSDGHAVLADFGLLKRAGESAAAETAAGRESPSVVGGREVGVGTPGYAAPEQFAGGEATPATDVHALGILADECFAGNPPRAWEKIVRRATASLPRQRYADAAAFARAVRRRHWRRNAVWAVVAVVEIASLAVLFSRAVRANRPAAMAREAERARETAVRHTSKGQNREIVEGIIRDMVVLEGADALPNIFRENHGFPTGAVLIARHEVTQAQWEALMENNPSRFRGADRPVDGVSIGDCLEFIGRLNRMPDVREAGLRFRLPTMQEWKLAAGDFRARRIDYYHQLAMQAGNPAIGRLPPEPEFFPGTGWFSDNSGNETHPVGQNPPDERGLFDLYGNVAELVFAPVHVASGTHRAFEVNGLPCKGGSCNQEREDVDDIPVLLAPLGREIETLPEEWQPIIRATDIPVRLPEAMAAAKPESVERFLGIATVGLRLFADRMPD